MTYRKGLSAALASIALPYGYALTVWSSGELVRHSHPKPSVADVFVFVAGAAVSYGVLRLLTGETEESASGIGKRHVLRAGAIHLAAIFGAAGVALGVAHVGGLWGWGLTSLAATSTYVVLVAVELAFELRD